MSDNEGNEKLVMLIIISTFITTVRCSLRRCFLTEHRFKCYRSQCISNMVMGIMSKLIT